MGILEQIKGGLVVSCQALPDEPPHSSFIAEGMALTAEQGGAVGIRVQDKEDIIEVKKVVNLPVVGIVKRSYPDSDIYVTATRKELDELFETGCEIIAIGTMLRDRPNGKKLKDLVDRVHEHGVLAMANCSIYEECVNAENISFDCVSTTLCGYTPYSRNVGSPNLELLKKLAETIKAPIPAEDKINVPENLAAVYKAGAYNAVVGGAITHPKQITEYFMKVLKK